MNYDPADYGVIGAGNDTAAIQGALDAIRAAGGGRLLLEHSTYSVDALNATNCSHLEVVACQGTVISSAPMTISAPILDLTGSHDTRIQGGYWTGPPPGSSAVMPKAAILVCDSDRTIIDGIATEGRFKSGALCIVAASSIECRGIQLFNRDSVAPTLMISSRNDGVVDWWLTSKFATIPNVLGVGDMAFYCCEVHALGGAQWTTYMRNANHIKFDSGLQDNSTTAHMMFEGANDRITADGVKFYSELGHPSQYVYQASAGSSCAHLRHYNSGYDPIADSHLTNGSFPYFLTT